MSSASTKARTRKSMEVRVSRDVTINIRVQQRQRSLIDQAAEAVGKNRSDFMLEAACQKAEDVLLDRCFFSLDEEQWQDFQAALDAPVNPNAKLKKLLQTPAPWDK